MRVPAALRELVRQRAAFRCEYCHVSEIYSSFSHEIEHIVSRKHRGPTAEENLALSCRTCNAFKGSDIASFHDDGQTLLRLFNPRTDDWPEHFRWIGPRLKGMTPAGRATIRILNINKTTRVAMRKALLKSGIVF